MFPRDVYEYYSFKVIRITRFGDPAENRETRTRFSPFIVETIFINARQIPTRLA